MSLLQLLQLLLILLQLFPIETNEQRFTISKFLTNRSKFAKDPT